MEAIQNFSAPALLNALVSLVTAFALGGMIGLERQMRQRTAGLRTNTLVAVGAAIFVSLGNRLFEIHGGNQGAVHVVAYVVSGIGFFERGGVMTPFLRGVVVLGGTLLQEPGLHLRPPATCGTFRFRDTGPAPILIACQR